MEGEALRAKLVRLEAENAYLRSELELRQAASSDLIGTYTAGGEAEPPWDLTRLGLTEATLREIERTVFAAIQAQFEARSLVAWSPGPYGPRWRELRCIPDFVEDGTLRRLHLYARDVTEREGMRQRLQEREAVQRSILENYPGGAIVVFDRALRYVYAGGRGLADVGLDPDDMVGRTIDEVFPAETADHIRPFYLAALRGESPTEDVPFRDRWYAVSHHPVRSADGRALYGMAITRDVTEQRTAERLRTETEARHRALVQSFPGAVFLFDPQGCYLAVGGLAVRETGYDPDALIGRNVVDATPKGDLLLNSLQECLRYGPRNEDVSYGGQVFEIRWSPVTNQGAPAVLAVVLDVTEQRREDRRRARDLAAQEALIREVHHRVKNNLQAVQSLLSIAARREGSAVARQALTDVRARIQAMSHVHEQLYRAADLARVRLDLFVEGLIRQLVRTSPALGRAEVSVDVAAVHLGADDALEVGLICTELLTNASKYALVDRNGKVEVAARLDAGGLVIEVADDGPGVSNESKESGSNLGLWLVTALCEHRGGALTLEPGLGARWRVTLPETRVFQD